MPSKRKPRKHIQKNKIKKSSLPYPHKKKPGRRFHKKDKTHPVVTLQKARALIIFKVFMFGKAIMVREILDEVRDVDIYIKAIRTLWEEGIIKVYPGEPLEMSVILPLDSERKYREIVREFIGILDTTFPPQM